MAAGLIGVIFLAVYVATLAPDVVGHDAGEFQFVPYVFGIPHYTGYPLYLLLGKAWSFLPLGSVAWRMNLLSAVFGALAAALTYLCGWELTRSRPAAVLAAVAVGLAPLEWTWSTIAGVRSLALVFVALAVLAALRWERAAWDGDAKLAGRRLLTLAFICGLGLDHHRTFALLLPLMAAYLLLVRWRTILDGRLMAKAAGVFLLPLALYGVLPLRAAHAPPFDQTNTATWPGFVNLVIAGTDSAAHLDLTRAQAVARVPELGPALAGTFSPLVLVLALLGAAAMAWRRPPRALLLAGYAAVLAWLTVVWNIGGQLNLVYLMPAYVPLALLAAAGTAVVLGLLARLADGPVERRRLPEDGTAVLLRGLARLLRAVPSGRRDMAGQSAAASPPETHGAPLPEEGPERPELVRPRGASVLADRTWTFRWWAHWPGLLRGPSASKLYHLERTSRWPPRPWLLGNRDASAPAAPPRAPQRLPELLGARGEAGVRHGEVAGRHAEVGGDEAPRLWSRSRRGWLVTFAGSVATLAVAAGGVYLGRAHFQPAPEALDDFRQELFRGHQARRLANALAELPPNATVVADWDQATPLWYGELVDRINPGVAISYPASTLPAVLANARGPVYLATATFRPQTTTVSAAGPFVQVLTQPATNLPPGSLSLGGAFGGEIELAGMAPLGQPQDAVLPVTVYWKALRRPAADYHVSVRLMPSPDRVAAQRDEAAPVLGLSPTSTWTPGQVTGDYYELDLRGLPDGAYDLAVVLYQALPGGGFRNLPFGGSDRAVLGRLILAAGQVRLNRG